MYTSHDLLWLEIVKLYFFFFKENPMTYTQGYYCFFIMSIKHYKIGWGS
jgi:hypothetical protein